MNKSDPRPLMRVAACMIVVNIVTGIGIIGITLSNAL